jgi:chromate transporter
VIEQDTSEQGSDVEVTTPTLASIAGVFARFANTTFGGGSATIRVLKEQVVEKRRWLRPREFELNYALSSLTPGTNLLAFCTAAGWTCRRWLGAIVALVASSVPCSLLAVLVTVFYEQLHGSVWFQAALSGALAAAVAIMLSTAWVFAEPHVKAAPRKAAIVVTAAAALSLGAHLTPVEILLLSAVAGVAWPVPKPKQEPMAKDATREAS